MLDHHPEVREAHDADELMFGTVESWILYVNAPLPPYCVRYPDHFQNLTGGVQGGLHVSDPTNASRTLLMDLRQLEWSPPLLKFFGFRSSILPKLVSSSQVYGSIASGSLKGVKVAGLVGDQQGALVGNKCFKEGEAKCTYGTGWSLKTTVLNDDLYL